MLENDWLIPILNVKQQQTNKQQQQKQAHKQRNNNKNPDNLATSPTRVDIGHQRFPRDVGMPNGADDSSVHGSAKARRARA